MAVRDASKPATSKPCRARSPSMKRATCGTGDQRLPHRHERQVSARRRPSPVQITSELRRRGRKTAPPDASSTRILFFPRGRDLFPATPSSPSAPASAPKGGDRVEGRNTSPANGGKLVGRHPHDADEIGGETCRTTGVLFAAAGVQRAEPRRDVLRCWRWDLPWSIRHPRADQLRHTSNVFMVSSFFGMWAPPSFWASRVKSGVLAGPASLGHWSFAFAVTMLGDRGPRRLRSSALSLRCRVRGGPRGLRR